jgi:hypothetical protein
MSSHSLRKNGVEMKLQELHMTYVGIESHNRVTNMHAVMTRTIECRNDFNLAVDESEITLGFEVGRDCPMVSVPASVHMLSLIANLVALFSETLKFYETVGLQMESCLQVSQTTRNSSLCWIPVAFQYNL